MSATTRVRALFRRHPVPPGLDCRGRPDVGSRWNVGGETYVLSEARYQWGRDDGFELRFVPEAAFMAWRLPASRTGSQPE